MGREDCVFMFGACSGSIILVLVCVCPGVIVVLVRVAASICIRIIHYQTNHITQTHCDGNTNNKLNSNKATMTH